MIYINSRINCDVIVSIKKSISDLTNSVIDGFVVLDDEDVPKLKNYYKLFDEVAFVPSIRKTKIIECVPRIIPKLNEIENAKLVKKDLEKDIQEE